MHKLSRRVLAAAGWTKTVGTSSEVRYFDAAAADGAVVFGGWDQRDTVVDSPRPTVSCESSARQATRCGGPSSILAFANDTSGANPAPRGFSDTGAVESWSKSLSD